MAESLPATFADIITAFQAVVQNVMIVRQEVDSQRAFLQLRGQYQDYQIHLREILRANGSRKYAYYVVREGQIIAGFDNAPDPRALHLKYGPAYVHHRSEAVPHFHALNRRDIELTAEMKCTTFLQWLEQNL